MTTSTAEAVIDRVVSKMKELSNVGLVHDRLRLATDENQITDLLVSEIGGRDTLRVWFVKLGPMTTSQADAASRMGWDREVIVEGYGQFEDGSGSETLITGIAERIARKLWYDAQTTKLNSTILWATPPEIEDTDPVTFAGVTCSSVRLRMHVHSLEDITNPT